MMTEEKNATADRPEHPAPEDVREIPLNSLDMKQIIEMDACTRCGECLTWCPVYDQDAKESIVPRRKVIDFLKIARTQHGQPDLVPTAQRGIIDIENALVGAQVVL